MKVIKCPNCYADVTLDPKTNQGRCEFCTQIVSNAPTVVPKTIIQAPTKQPEPQKTEMISLLDYITLIDDEKKYQIGNALLHGIGVEKNEYEALVFLKTAAQNGHGDAAYQCYIILNEVVETKEEFEDALHYLKIAKNAGHKGAIVEYNRIAQLSKKQGADLGLGIVTNEVASDYTTKFYNALPYCVRFRCSSPARGSSGSGYILSNGYILTNAHVILVGESKKTYPDITVYFEDSIDTKPYKVKVVEYDSKKDIAVCKFDGVVQSHLNGNGLEFNAIDDLKVGQAVFTIGNPLGRGISFTEGYISKAPVFDNFENREVVRTNITIYGGNSGGALFNQNNEIVGMISYTECKFGYDNKGKETIVLDAHAMSGAVTAKTSVDYLNSLDLYN
ncbi:MAG: trypsin-like peptidase domain-containing protein [Clostridia bacterium]|nr:trypsin-like peptidase domain-containing protein [Clostridia bacterium]